MLQNLRYRFQHYRRAWRYAFGTLTESDAISLLLDAEQASGVHSLESITARDVENMFREMYGEVANAHEYAKDAVARVASTWGSNSEALGVAQDLALVEMQEYAERDGVALKELHTI